jgi:hypothetical protein
MKLRWPLAVVVLALLVLALIGGEATVPTAIVLIVLTVGIAGTIWGLIRRRPL